MTSQGPRRTDILAAAGRRFAAAGVAGTTVREIADDVGLNAGALYHYFPSKDAILHELITAYLRELLERYRARELGALAPRDRLRAIVEASLETAAAQPEATHVYQAEFGTLRAKPEYREARSFSDALQQEWLDAIEAGKDAGVFRRDIPTRVFHRFLRDSVWLTVRWHTSDDSYTVADLTHYCMSVFLDGFATRGADRSTRRRPTSRLTPTPKQRTR
jgi:AcrR family transcriptional regulator